MIRTEAGRRLWRFLDKRWDEAGLLTPAHIADVEQEAAAAERERLRVAFDSMLDRGAYLRPQVGTFSNGEPPPRYWADLITELLSEPET